MSRLFNGSNYIPTFDLTGASAGTGVGVTAVSNVPTTAASAGIAPVFYVGTSAQTAKPSAGNLYSWQATQASAAGKVVLLNLAAAPAANATITPLQCVDIAAANGAAASDNAVIPDRLSTGITFVFSTSCTTYTSAGTINLRVRAS